MFVRERVREMKDGREEVILGNTSPSMRRADVQINERLTGGIGKESKRSWH